MKRIALLCCVLSLVLVLSMRTVPVSAQSLSGVESWVPADFTGFIRLDTSNPQDALRGINVSILVGSLIQPTRINTTQAIGFNDLLPMAGLLDLEFAPFEQIVVPWLGDSLVVAYREMTPTYRAGADDVLLIASTRDAFQAASVLSTVLQAQDLLETSTYRGATVYNLDQTSIAFAGDAVLIGEESLIHAALDTEAGDAERLIDQPAYLPIREALGERDPIFAYFVDDTAANALGYLLSGSDRAAPLIRALGDSLSILTEGEAMGPEQALLSGAVDALGVSLRPDTFLISQVNVHVAYHASGVDSAAAESVFDETMLNYIPRSAFLVHAGADSRRAAYGVISALPLANYGSRILAGFPVGQMAPSPQDLVAPPTGSDLASVVEGFLEALNAVRGVDLLGDVVSHFDGSYTTALIPRPNNPVPVLNTPFDALIVAQVDDADATTESLTGLAEALFGVEFAAGTGDRDDSVVLSTADGEPVIRISAVDENTLVIGTGDSVSLALLALAGDNQLITQPRWQQFVENDEPVPNLYLDLVGFYNTFQPSAGGAQAVPTSYIGLQTSALGGGFFRADLNVFLPE